MHIFENWCMHLYTSQKSQKSFFSPLISNFYFLFMFYTCSVDNVVRNDQVELAKETLGFWRLGDVEHTKLDKRELGCANGKLSVFLPFLFHSLLLLHPKVIYFYV
jgi:hypothetical protein